LSCYLPPLIYFCVPCSGLVPMRGDDLVVVMERNAASIAGMNLVLPFSCFPRDNAGGTVRRVPTRSTGSLDGTATLTCANRLSARAEASSD
jgi:hypothetical protein